jgi:hypothetical protein
MNHGLGSIGNIGKKFKNLIHIICKNFLIMQDKEKKSGSKSIEKVQGNCG